MKIKGKEKTETTYTIKLSQKEMTELYLELYDAVGLDGFEKLTTPRIIDLFDALRAKVHGL